jgi:hypothetical protein
MGDWTLAIKAAFLTPITSNCQAPQLPSPTPTHFLTSLISLSHRKRLCNSPPAGPVQPSDRQCVTDSRTPWMSHSQTHNPPAAALPTHPKSTLSQPPRICPHDSTARPNKRP